MAKRLILRTKTKKKKKAAPASVTEGSWMSSGYSAVKKQVITSKNRKSKSWIPEFWIKDGEDADIRILTEPICINSHRVPTGRKVPDNFTCLEGTGEPCILCEAGEKTYQRQWQSCLAIIDRRTEEWTDRQGTQHKHKNRVKLWRCGIRVAGVLEKITSKKGDLRQFEIEVSRTGAGQASTYMFDVGEKCLLSSKDKEARDKFDVIDIIKPKSRKELIASIAGLAEGGDGDDDEDDDDVMEY